MVYKDKVSLASLIINIIVSKVYTVDDRAKCLNILQNTRSFLSIPKQDWMKISSIRDAK